jgi:hypothetical protein
LAVGARSGSVGTGVRSTRRHGARRIGSARERINTDTCGITRCLSSLSGGTSKTSRGTIYASAVRGIGYGTSRTRCLAISANTTGTTVGTVIGGDTRLSGLFKRAPVVGETRALAKLILRVANSLSISVRTVSSSASRSRSTTIVSTTNGDGSIGTIDTSTVCFAVGTAGTNTIAVQRATFANTKNTNLLIGSCTTIGETTVSVG